MTAEELRDIKERSRRAGTGHAPNKRVMENDIRALLKEVAILRSKLTKLGPDDELEWKECVGGGWIKGIYRENLSDLVG